MEEKGVLKNKSETVDQIKESKKQNKNTLPYRVRNKGILK